MNKKLKKQIWDILGEILGKKVAKNVEKQLFDFVESEDNLSCLTADDSPQVDQIDKLTDQLADKLADVIIDCFFEDFDESFFDREKEKGNKVVE